MKLLTIHRVPRPFSRQVDRGFTIIELLITVAIIGILVAIALPAYQEHVRRGKRADAQATLVQAAQFMQTFYATNQRYDRAVGEAAGDDDERLPTLLRASPSQGTDTAYQIQIATKTNGFVLTATPTGSMSDDHCGDMTLTHDAVKGARGGTDSGDVAACWR